MVAPSQVGATMERFSSGHSRCSQRQGVLLADVNGDGVVNIQDVVLVAASFGAAGEKRD